MDLVITDHSFLFLGTGTRFRIPIPLTNGMPRFKRRSTRSYAPRKRARLARSFSRFKRRLIRGKGRSGVPRTLSNRVGFPSSLRMKHSVTQQYSWDTATWDAANPFKAAWVCNSVVNPFIHAGSGVIADPPVSYLTTIGRTYNHVRVVSSRIVIQFTHRTIDGYEDSPMNARICTFIDDDAVVDATDMNRIAMRPGAFHKQIALQANGTARFSRKWNIKKYFGARYPVAQLTGTSTTQPEEKSYFMVAISALDARAKYSPILNAVVTITFEAIWTEPRESIT